MLRSRLKTIIVAVAMMFAAGEMKAANVCAQVAVVARDSTNPYQKSRFTHVRRVLLYNYTLGGGQGPPSGPFNFSNPPLLNSLTRLANKYGFQLDVSGSSTYITEAALGLSGPDSANPVNVAVFANGDGDVLANATSLAAMKKFVEVRGLGLLQIHASAGYVPCPTSGAENLFDPNCRWLARVLVRQYMNNNGYPDYARIYVDSTRQGEVPPNAPDSTAPAAVNHGKQNPEFRGIFDSLPSNDGVIGGSQPGVWDSLGDEWFSYRGYVRQQGEQTFDGILFGPVFALLSQDETAPYNRPSLKMGDRVQAWARHVGLGLTAYNNAGGGSVYTNSRRVNGQIVRDSIIEKINWRIIRYLARDFVGCMDSKYKEYNPEATISFITPGIDSTLPCKTLNSTSIQLVKGRTSSGITLSSGHMQIPTPEAGTYRIVITDAKGKQVIAKTVMGGLNKRTEVSNLNKGVYFVEVHSSKKKMTVTRIHFLKH